MEGKTVILFTCLKEAGYTRNEAIIESLSANPHYKVILATSKLKSYFSRLTEVLLKLVRVRFGRRPDLVVVGFMAQPLIPIVRMLFPKTPMLMDGFISIYDALVVDRKLIGKDTLLSKIVFETERWVFNIPEKVLFDTRTHCQHIARQFGLGADKLDYLYLLASPKRFKKAAVAPGDHSFKVFYYSTFLPLHGVDVVVKAAKILKLRRDITFTIVGRGQESDRVNKLVNEYSLDHVRFIDWIDYHRLPREIAKHQLCLAGHFSSNPKAGWVIPGKAYQFCLMCKPVVLTNLPSNKELFTDMKSAIFCKASDPKDLADKIVFASKNRRKIERIGAMGGLIIKNNIKTSVIKLNQTVDSLIK